MVQQCGPREPEMSIIGPIWFHGHGMKMLLAESGLGEVYIHSSAAWVRLYKSITDPGDWLVDWEVTHSPHARARGSIEMDTQQLQAAFGLNDYDGGVFGVLLLSRFGGESAVQGKYIRWQRFLNIPGPGTGHDGDPNVSIELDDRVKAAIRDLIAAS